MKTALTRHLEKRRDFAKQEARKINIPSLKQRKAVGEDSISKGRREIIIEPSCSEVMVQKIGKLYPNMGKVLQREKNVTVFFF